MATGAEDGKAQLSAVMLDCETTGSIESLLRLRLLSTSSDLRGCNVIMLVQTREERTQQQFFFKHTFWYPGSHSTPGRWDGRVTAKNCYLDQDTECFGQGVQKVRE